MNDIDVEERGAVGPRTVPPDRAPAPAPQPRWRRDFPIDWAEDDYVSRRDLVKFMVLTSGAFVAGQLWILYKSLFQRQPATRQQVPVASVDELPVGGAKTFHYPAGSTPRLLVRTGERAFVAYDQQCTHLQCPVVPAIREGKLHCPCHNGWFDLQTGVPLSGPPQRRLPRIELEVREETVFATGVEDSAT
ncbi:MAG TPA: Rieske (2Fe-2S) protein [Polyangiaceae bacterium]